MLEYYEPRLNLAVPEELNIMGIVVSLQEPVDGELLRGVVEELRLAGLPCELLSNEPLRMCTVQGMRK